MKDTLSGKKHLFFDLDDTITPSRSRIAPHMAKLLASLSADLIIISGAQVSQIRTQVGELPFYTLGQNGNQAIAPNGEVLWNEVLSPDEVAYVRRHIDDIISLGVDPHDPNDMVEERGAQVAFSPVGHNAPLERKRAFDPSGDVRRRMLAERPFVSDTIEVKIGGTTCLDYFKKGSHKGTNVARLIDHVGWERNNCVYFGDKLCPGGNDEVVIGVIGTVPVTDSEHTYSILKEVFGIVS